jgi:hypothetical protein
MFRRIKKNRSLVWKLALTNFPTADGSRVQWAKGVSGLQSSHSANPRDYCLGDEYDLCFSVEAPTLEDNPNA